MTQQKKLALYFPSRYLQRAEDKEDNREYREADHVEDNIELSGAEEDADEISLSDQF